MLAAVLSSPLWSRKCAHRIVSLHAFGSGHAQQGQSVAQDLARGDEQGEARVALRGVPEDEADLLSYIFFDKRFTAELIALGRDDARRQEDEIVALLTN